MDSRSSDVPLSKEAYVRGIERGDRAMLARAITLFESALSEHRAMARDVLERLVSRTGNAIRIGVSGPPGVGKSTFIDAFGCALLAAGRRVAVLAIDPSSTRTGGSILGDKTRMARLAKEDAAFIRPSPTRGVLGGIAHHTYETVLLCEASGFDVVIVETVGVGQSEEMVAQVVDFHLVLLSSGAGDELQGIKRGALESADMVAITKADGEHVSDAENLRTEYERALAIVAGDGAASRPVVVCSAKTGLGLDAIAAHIETHHSHFRDSGELDRRRADQRVRWTWWALERELVHILQTDPRVLAVSPEVERAVRAGELLPTVATERLLDTFLKRDPPHD